MNQVLSAEHPTTIDGGRYEVRGMLGQGGMAMVYRVWDRRLRVERAVKVLSPAFSDKAPLRRRFEMEARTMARLQHPNIAAVHDVGEENGQIFMVMELVEGGSLADRGRMSARAAAETTVAVLRALEVAHANGVVHRDIKPQNILLTKDGTPKVTDFGIAHVQEDDSPSMTKTGSVIGTWAYMSPEQRAGARGIDGRTDVYAVGATMVSLLTGELPGDLFVSELHGRLLVRVPGVLRPLVQKATRYGMEDRFRTAAEMAEALVLLVPSLPEGAEPVPLTNLAALLPEAGVPPVSSNETMQLDSLADGGPSVVHPPAGVGARSGRWRWGVVMAGVVALLVAAAVVASLPLGGTAGDEATHSLGAGAPVDPPAGEASALPSRTEPDPASLAAAAPALPSATPAPEVRPSPATESAAGRSTSNKSVATAETPRSAAIPPPAPTSASEAPTSSATSPLPAAPPVEASVSQEPARFQATGDAAGVWLVAGGKRYPPGEVPPGSYTIEASFGGGDPMAAGKLTLAAGDDRTVKCDGSFMKCR